MEVGTTEMRSPLSSKVASGMKPEHSIVTEGVSGMGW